MPPPGHSSRSPVCVVTFALPRLGFSCVSLSTQDTWRGAAPMNDVATVSRYFPLRRFGGVPSRARETGFMGRMPHVALKAGLRGSPLSAGGRRRRKRCSSGLVGPERRLVVPDRGDLRGAAGYFRRGSCSQCGVTLILRRGGVSLRARLRAWCVASRSPSSGPAVFFLCSLDVLSTRRSGVDDGRRGLAGQLREDEVR